MTERTETCQWCRYWGVGESNPGLTSATIREGYYTGVCRRRSPTRGGWHSTSRADWCGEFEPIACGEEGGSDDNRSR